MGGEEKELDSNSRGCILLNSAQDSKRANIKNGN